MRRAPAARRLFCPSPSRLSRCSLRQPRPRRGAPLRFGPIEEWGDRAALRAPLFVSGRGTSRKIRPRLRRVEQGTMASKPKSSNQGTPPSGATTPRTNAATVAQPRASAPSAFCKSDACRRTHFGPVTVCKFVAHDLAGRSLLHIRRPVPFASSSRAPRAERGILPRIAIIEKHLGLDKKIAA
jgi:hypothetical protein